MSAVDGYLVDEGGEVVGLADPVTIDDPEKADAMLARIGRHEAHLRALAIQEASVRANFARMRREHERAVEWLRRRFSPEFEAWARSQLEGKRSKTLVLAHGRISLRTAKARAKITDKRAAVAWVQEHAPDRVKVRHDVTAADALAAWNESEESDDLGNPLWMQVEGQREVVRIKTGLEG